MINKHELQKFIEPYYADKDIMHNMWHIELVEKQMNRIIELGQYKVNREYLSLALAFHGFIYKYENRIRKWLSKHGYSKDDIDHIVKIAWESQRPEIPNTLEGKILHDAHVLEGGKSYTVVKTLITGSVRGQPLKETLAFMEKNVLGKNICYLPETMALCDEMNMFTEEFFKILSEGIMWQISNLWIDKIKTYGEDNSGKVKERRLKF